jgi:hypothetical protein
MSPRSRCFDRTPAVRAFIAAAVLALLSADAMRGDDRDLLRAGTADPYLFILLDTSGSMNWSPKNDATCPTGDCWVPFQADDPQSKFYQAKQALYEVLNDPKFPAASLGFATYNQDALAVPSKHWLYQATSSGPSVPSWGAFPASGAQEVFGLNWGCDTGNNDNEIGCTSAKPADLVDPWELARMQRLPKGGQPFAITNLADFFIRSSGTVYRVLYAPKLGGSYGSNLTVTVSVWRCKTTTCTIGNATHTTLIDTKDVTYKPLGEFLSWDNAGTNTQRTNPELTYFSGTANDSAAGGTCNGWDPNTDPTKDPPGGAGGYNLRFATDATDTRGSLFYVGDVVPLDWKTDHKTDILRRLSPSYPAAPDYRIATYLKDYPIGSETFLRLKDEAMRPLFASGSTPIGNSFEYFKEWYTAWAAVAGSKDPAVQHDDGFSCRSKYLLILTDGDETCGDPNGTKGPNGKVNKPCDVANELRALGVTVFVVAFGVTATPGNQLSCIADDQHTFYPQDKDELVASLKKVIGLIKEDPRAFASAAVPSVQAEVEDRIYLSTFRPINAFSFDDDGDGKVDDGAFTWDGHLDAYLKPLPTKGGKPDRTKDCPATTPRSSCHLWDAGTVLKGQAPTQSTLAAASTLDEGTLRLGVNTNQRRLFYAKAPVGDSVPGKLRLFVPPTGDIKTDADWKDLWRGFKLVDPATNAEYTATKKRVETIVKKTIQIKQTEVQNVGTVTWVLGDIFHSDPVLVDRPNNFFYYASNLHGLKGIDSDCINDTSYRCFSKKHRTRRKMLLVGANDGQLHAFDAGLWNGTLFTAGKGTELFSYMPRIGMPIVRDQTEGGHQIFGVDGTPRINDVFLDPNHSGVPDPAKREWRTVAVGGFREGGSIDGGGHVSDTDFYSGYYALDMTQPDSGTQGDLPSCLSLQNQTSSSCGTLPFPAVLWEFSDTYGASRMDEDQNNVPDLGQTWSVPTVGRIQVIESAAGGDKIVEKFVAIFGGGMDRDNKFSPKRGTWLYMVDIETGKTLYKRALVGAAASDPAVVDVDLDGFLDTIYIGTTAGLLYKVDIKSPAKIENVTFDKNQFSPPLSANVQIPRISDVGWDPFPIFDTGGKPIYIAPTAFFVSKLGKFALALGTGDREDLWVDDPLEGRFYLFLDDDFTADMVAAAPPTLPKHETDYKQILPADGATTADYVLDPTLRGWYLKLPVNQRVITQPFGLSGILIFSSFLPDKKPCSTGGTSNLYVVFANNGNPVMTENNTPVRARVINDVVTNPVVEQGQTKNSPTDITDPTPPEDQMILDKIQEAIVKSLKSLAPKECKFANFWFNVNGVRSDTGIERYATIPVCSIERNWKDN